MLTPLKSIISLADKVSWCFLVWFISYVVVLSGGLVLLTSRFRTASSQSQVPGAGQLH